DVAVRDLLSRGSGGDRLQPARLADRGADPAAAPVRPEDYGAGMNAEPGAPGLSPAGEAETALVLDLDGYEGPIDLLLALARQQKVDWTRISILAFADQYLAFIAAQRRMRREVAADYLVRAAWLAYLKSRLLLPEPPAAEDEPSAAELAAALSHRLQLLAAMQ